MHTGTNPDRIRNSRIIGDSVLYLLLNCLIQMNIYPFAFSLLFPLCGAVSILGRRVWRAGSAGTGLPFRTRPSATPTDHGF